MSAEVLRRAASQIRERAEVATPGPWRATDEGLTHPGAGMQVAAGGGGVATDCCSYQGAATRVDAEHIASWHPAVALAVVDWLDKQADMSDSGNGIPAMRGRGYEQALAVARAYLGETA